MALDMKAYFDSIPKAQRYLLIGLIVVGVLTGYYFLMNPLWEEKGRHEASLEKLQVDLQQKQLIAANRPKLEAEIKVLEKELADALVRLPEEKEIPKLLTQVNTLGQQNGLEFLLFRPGATAQKGFYAEVPVEMRVEGQYHALGSFLDRVSKLERIVNVSDIRVTPLQAQAQRADRADRSIVADLKATTYTFLEKGGSASAPAK